MSVFSTELRTLAWRGLVGKLGPLVVLVSCVGCTGKDNPVTPSLPDGLIVLDGADKVKVTAEHGGVVAYELQEAYPAPNAISELNRRLGQAVWQPLEHDVLNPTVETSQSRGWYQYQDRLA